MYLPVEKQLLGFCLVEVTPPKFQFHETIESLPTTLLVSVKSTHNDGQPLVILGVNPTVGAAIIATGYGIVSAGVPHPSLTTTEYVCGVLTIVDSVEPLLFGFVNQVYEKILSPPVADAFKLIVLPTPHTAVGPVISAVIFLRTFNVMVWFDAGHPLPSVAEIE